MVATVSIIEFIGNPGNIVWSGSYKNMHNYHDDHCDEDEDDMQPDFITSRIFDVIDSDIIDVPFIPIF